LPRPGAGIEVRSGTKRRDLSIARLPPLGKERRDERSTAGDQRGKRGTRRPRAGFSEGGKHPDCRDGAPLRGGSRNGDLGRSGHAEGSPTFREHADPTTMGCSTCWGGGELPTLSHGLARERLGVPSLPVIRPTARTQPLLHPSSAQPTVESGRRLARGVKKSGGLRCPTSRQACAAVRRCRWCGVARCLLSLGRGRAVACRALRRRRAGSGGQRDGTGSPSKGALLPARARIGRSRSCSRVVDVVAEIDRRCQAQRSGRSPLHPIWRTFMDGRLARGPMYESM